MLQLGIFGFIESVCVQLDSVCFSGLGSAFCRVPVGVIVDVGVEVIVDVGDDGDSGSFVSLGFTVGTRTSKRFFVATLGTAIISTSDESCSFSILVSAKKFSWDMSRSLSIVEMFGRSLAILSDLTTSGDECLIMFLLNVRVGIPVDEWIGGRLGGALVMKNLSFLSSPHQVLRLTLASKFRVDRKN